jgi:DNA repair protein RecO (recombination protein O)
MLQKTKGIVLSFVKYRETSIICRIYTEEFGLQSYMVNGARTAPSKSTKSKIGLYQPLTLLDLVVYYRKNNNSSINRISEVRCSQPYSSLTTDFRKISIAMFIVEILNKTLKEEEAHPELFEFLYTSLVALDELEHDFENFHLLFLLKLSRYLGFYPSSAGNLYSEVLNEAGWSRIIDPAEAAALDAMLGLAYKTPYKISQSIRRSLLLHLLKFYGLHVESFGEVRSIQVLQDVMS